MLMAKIVISLGMEKMIIFPECYEKKIKTILNISSSQLSIQTEQKSYRSLHEKSVYKREPHLALGGCKNLPIIV